MFVSCTALKIVDVLDKIEKKLNTIVISSNQAIIWDCLMSVDIDSKIEGYGKLLASWNMKFFKTNKSKLFWLI